MAFDHALISFFLFFIILISTVIISLVASESIIHQELVFNGFNNSETNLTLIGSSVIKQSGALRLTNISESVIGHAFYHHPIQMFEKDGSSNASSFSTYFVFAIVPQSRTKRGGHGLAFTISPSKEFRNAEAGQFMGIFNSLNDKLASNRIFAVEFDTVSGFNESAEAEGNHVGININSMHSLDTEYASYHPNSRSARVIILESGDSIQAWVDYDGVNKFVNVTIAPLLEPKPLKSLLGYRTDLSAVFKRNMFVGFSASTGKKASYHFILGWSFRINGLAPPLNQSQLPKPPKNNEIGHSLKMWIKVFIGTLACVIFLLGMWGFIINRRKRHIEVFEEWELDCPHRFRYDDLVEATKGFKESEMIGAGGFGTVYKGVLPCSGSEIAVKKFARSSIQGVAEFAAEVKSLGKLRHKNLVNLQGWCKEKEDLLLVYDYFPHGSLDSLLYNNPQNIKFILSWDQRRNILKGVASGLLYLHEEWDQVVIHRDVKSSNVLIDCDINGRLGDFGLARLYNHNQDSHTTNVVGTPGYIAPELARTGKSSTSSDVYAYGVLILKVTTGRRPVYKDTSSQCDTGYVILMDWVMQCEQMGRILDAVDPKLNENYVVDDVEMVLRLGLMCSHPNEQARPTMRRVIRYLNRDEAIPNIIDDWHSASFDSFHKLTARFEKLVSSDSWITKSDPCSSFTALSSTSSIGGR